MPITTATTASKKAGAPAPHADLVTNVDTEFNLGDHEMASSDLSYLSDGEVPNVEMSTEEVDKPFPLNPREEDIPSNIVCSDLIDCTILIACSVVLLLWQWRGSILLHLLSSCYLYGQVCYSFH